MNNTISSELLLSFKKSYSISETHKEIRKELNDYVTIINEHSPLNKDDVDMMVDNLKRINDVIYKEEYNNDADMSNSEDLLFEVRNILNMLFENKD